MKTSHQFLKNLSNKLVLIGVVILPLLFQKVSFANTVPGLYQSFESFIDLEKEKFVKKIDKLRKGADSLNDLKDISSVDLDPAYLNHILFYTPNRYAVLAQKDKCSFYDLIQANLIKDHTGPVDYFIIRYTPEAGKPRRAFVDKKIFLEKIAIKECPQLFSFESYFNQKNFSKTIKTLNIQTPKTMDDCYSIHKSFIKDFKTPYLCSINEKIDSIKDLEFRLRNTPSKEIKIITELNQKIKEAKYFKGLINNKAYDYLNNLCENLDRPKLFCEDFFQKDFWNQIISGEKSYTNAKALCMSIFNNNKISESDITNCIRKIKSDNDICKFANSFYPSIIPRPNCQNIGKALNYSKLKSEYNDCPALTGNEGIVNISRILNHFQTPNTSSASLCSLPSINQFIKFNEEFDGRAWKVRLCYQDKINEKEICLPTLTGNVESSEYSFGKVVAKILQKTKAAPANLICEMVDKKEYNPVILKYSSGCWILFDPQKCSGTSCPNKIIYNEKEITHIKLRKNTTFDYFPNQFTTAKLAQSNLLVDNLKLKTKKVLNISELKNIFAQNKNSIIHGIGCSEDLLPSYFKKLALNQCSPLPFIIDGYLEEDGYISVVIRTAVDDLHAPRILSWANLFSGVKSYQMQHPLNMWGLYAIY